MVLLWTELRKLENCIIDIPDFQWYNRRVMNRNQWGYTCQNLYTLQKNQV